MSVRKGTAFKVIIGMICVSVVGFFAFQVLNNPHQEIEEVHEVVKLKDRRITKSPFIENSTRRVSETEQENLVVESGDTITSSVPENVPTAQSQDSDIKEFQSWLSSNRKQNESVEEVESKENEIEETGMDYAQEKSKITSVIELQWRNAFESYDIEGYMGAIWEDDFFYISDMGTPNNMDDDVIFRGGQKEREGALRIFNTTRALNMDLSKNGDIEFLSDTIAMVEYNYGVRFTFEGSESYTSGRMAFVLEHREDGGWRILEWYDYANPHP
ncbi:hypothetical protein C6497_12690 [Candidatus Poribacteria bacterium]|nr:MAG: hypothetical protein C6497_12690 [Candidatus Poribacteria bacterium]